MMFSRRSIICAAFTCLFAAYGVSGQEIEELFSESFSAPAGSTSEFLSIYSPPWMEELNPSGNEITVGSFIQCARFTESFDTLAGDSAAFEAAYSPPWFFTDADDDNLVRVEDRLGGNPELQIAEIVEFNSRRRVLVDGYDPTACPVLLVETDVNAIKNFGWYEVGMDLGGVFINFAPGYSPEPGEGQGWFKINNTWGGGDVGGTDMGFVPPTVVPPDAGVMHHMEVLWTQATGEFDITITDGSNPANVFNFFFSHPTAVAAGGNPIGLYRGGSHDHFPDTEGHGLYDNFSVTPMGEGQLLIKEVAGAEETDTYVSVPGYDPNDNRELVVEADIGASSSNGRYAVGLNLGGVIFDFHPGFGNPPLGAFRIDNQWGGGDVPDTDMGFVPANEVMHHVEIHWKQRKGEFDVTITDGANPANVFNFFFSEPSAVAAGGQPIGLVRVGLDDGLPESDGFGLYDNFKISHILPRCPHTLFADVDGDGDVDLIDFSLFQLCHTGPDGGPLPTIPSNCTCFDREPDGDVDRDDFLEFAACTTGSAVPYDLQELPSGCSHLE